jgi:hypothetical protein
MRSSDCRPFTAIGAVAFLVLLGFIGVGTFVRMRRGDKLRR